MKEVNEIKKNCFIRDEKWFEWRFMSYPKKENLIFLRFEKTFIIGLRSRWYKFDVLKILFSNNFLDSNLQNMLTLWCKRNKFTFFSFIEKANSESNSYFFAKKLKYISYSSLKEFGNNFTENFDDLQFADSDIGF